MVHSLVEQLRFTRCEWRRALGDVSDDDARRRLLPMNSISWLIGHLTWQEHEYWLVRLQGKVLFPEARNWAYEAPASTPPIDEVWKLWQAVTQATDPFLDTMTTEALQKPIVLDGKSSIYTAGSLLLRVTYHYWYHTGEGMAIRQMLGHSDLPDFVGDIDTQAPYKSH